VWSNVLAHPRVRDLDPAAVDRWHVRATPVRRTLGLLRQASRRQTSQDETPFETSAEPHLARYLDAAQRLYGAVAEVTGSRVIVDTSKRSGDAAALLLMEEVDARFVHLVRDPRAVAYSWAKRDARGHGSAATSRDWVAFNLLDEAVRRRAGRGRSLRLRYEDLVADPESTLRTVAGLLGERPDRLPVSRSKVAALGANHGVMGNPSRFLTGEVELREDVEWRAAQSPNDRRIVTALALPLMLRYGYRTSSLP
jgi:hypothetical protein